MLYPDLRATIVEVLLTLCRWQHGDKESFICYVLYILLFVIDYSLLALVLPLSLFCYAQLAQHPSRLYWQVWRGAVACEYSPIPQTLLTLQ